MKVLRLLVICIVLAGTLALGQANPAAVLSVKPTSRSHVATRFGQLPLAFESNRGQLDAQVKFLSHGLGPVVSFSSERIVIGSGSKSLSLSFRGSRPQPRIESTDQLPGKVNYLIGKDPSKWITQVPTFAVVRYVGVYPGIDVRFHGKGSQLEYDFEVAPGADPRQIRVRFDSDARLHTDASGDLLIEQGSTSIRQHPPQAYQEVNGLRKGIAAHAIIGPGNDLGFVLAGYDRKRALVIDPAIVYETQISGSNPYPPTQAVAVDSAGEMFLTGTTLSDFVTTAGAFQQQNAGGEDAFVIKLSSDGQSVLYATYLGGSDEENAYSIALDGSGDAYIVGSTLSLDFPATPNAFQRTARGGICHGIQCSDTFVSVLAPDGTALVYSSYLGSSEDDYASSIAVDPLGAAYITGVTYWPDFPTTPGAFKTTCPGSAPGAFVSKIDPSKSGISSLVYSTFVCGDDANYGASANGIAVDSAGEAFIVGSTDSTTLATPGAYQTKNRGAAAYVAKLNATGSDLIFATLLGGPNYGYCLDEGKAIAIDSSGNSYITGVAGTPTFPTTPGAFQTVKKSPITNAFIAKFNSTGSALLYSTLLGGSGGPLIFGSCVSDFGTGIVVDASGNAYLTGQTTSQDFPITNTTVEAVCNPGINNGGCPGSFVTEVNPSGAGLAFSTYLGASVPADVTAITTTIVLDASDHIYVTGSGHLPTINAPPPPPSGSGFITKIDLTAHAPAAALLPTYPNFGIVATGSSSQLDLKLTDRGDSDLAITGIAFSGDSFTQTNDCQASLAPAASCTITVTFSPTTVGIKGAQVTITDSAFDSPHFAYILGTGGTANGQINVGSLSFGDQALNTPSKPQPVKLSSIGNASLSIISIATTGDFAQTNNCGNSLPAGSSCTISVTFTPTELDSRSGMLTIVSNSSNTIPPVLLGGNGVPSLNLGVAPGTLDTATVTAGSPASYTLSIGGGGLGGTATLTCTGAPTGATCSVPASVPVDQNTASMFNVSVTTTARMGASLHRALHWFWALALIGVVVLSSRGGRRSGLRSLSWLSVVLTLLLASCGGGGGGNGGGGSGSGGTAVGTYTLNVKAAMGNTTQSKALTLIVK